jgi:hypothetical protein
MVKTQTDRKPKVLNPKVLNYIVRSSIGSLPRVLSQGGKSQGYKTQGYIPKIQK